MIFIPIYAAVVYRQRGRGWAGLLVSGFAIAPGPGCAIMVPHLYAACVLGLRGLPCVWYAAQAIEVWAWRKEKLCGCAGRDSGLSCGDIFGGAAVDAGSGREPSTAHLRCTLHRMQMQRARALMNAHRRNRMRWPQPGDGSLPLGEKAALGTVGEFAGKAVRELRADYLLAYAGWRYGIACAATLAAAVAGALAWLWRTA